MRRNLKLGLALSVGAALFAGACASNTESDDAESGDNALVGSISDPSFDLPSNYQAGTAEEKQAQLWDRVERTDYRDRRSSWPANQIATGVANLFAYDSLESARQQFTNLGMGPDFLKKSFETDADEQPVLSQGVRRRKVVHNLGSAVKVELVPRAGSPYTGLFQGAVGIARLSLASKPFRTVFGTQAIKLTPGVAVKLLVDGKPSVNLHAMPGVDGIEGFDFFSRPFSNAIGKPTGIGTKFIGDLFQAAIAPAPADHLAIDGFASVDRHGNTPASVKSPAQIFLIATGAAVRLEGQSEDADFRAALETLPSGPLFDVYALESGDVITDPAAVDAALNEGKITKIATLNATSSVISSKYEDDRLFFNHQKLAQ